MKNRLNFCALFSLCIFTFVFVGCVPDESIRPDNKLPEVNIEKPSSKDIPYPPQLEKGRCNCEYRVAWVSTPDDSQTQDFNGDLSLATLEGCGCVTCYPPIIGFGSDPCSVDANDVIGNWYPFNCKPPAKNFPFQLKLEALYYGDQECPLDFNNVCSWFQPVTARIQIRCTGNGKYPLNLTLTANSDYDPAIPCDGLERDIVKFYVTSDCIASLKDDIPDSPNFPGGI